MRVVGGLSFLLATSLATSASLAKDDAKAARFHYMLNCQGCHQPSGAGSEGGAPDMRGVVSQFLAVDGGRAYLARVPGVAFSPLGDEDLAVLLNWVLKEYDPKHLPEGFKPYSAEEISELRSRPLIDDAATVRDELFALLREARSKGQ